MVYEASMANGIVCTQDTIHICTKSRNRLLKPDIKLPMGNKTVSIKHLQQLLKIEQKSVHKLTYMDVFPVDRMNSKSFNKIVDDCVINSLKKKVPGSEATVQYLLIFRDISDSFLKFDMAPLQRIQFMYRGLFFLRIWRDYIKKSPFYNLESNFISSNLYRCIELNAKALVQIMKMLRDANREEEFLPYLFDSQTCERFFSLLRSVGTTNFTKINFDMLDLIYMINRIETQNDIAYSKLNIPGIEFPNKRVEKTKFYKLPSNAQILDTISRAKEEAFQTATFFKMTNGLALSDEVIEKYEFNSTIRADVVEPTVEPETEELVEYDSDIEDLLNDFDENAPNHGDDDEIEDGHFDKFVVDDDNGDKIDENSSLTYITDINGERKTILKSRLLWILTEQTEKLSNDRLRRFQSSLLKNGTSRKWRRSTENDNME